MFQSTPKAALGRVLSVSMELNIDSPYCRGQGMIVKNRELCPEAVAYMASIGFRYVGRVFVPPVRPGLPSRLELANTERCPEIVAERGTHHPKCEIQAYFINEAPTGGLTAIAPSELPMSP